MRYLISFLTYFVLTQAVSQQVVEKGVLYQPGDSIYGPRYGVMSSIPEGWVGIVPEGSELFILESTLHMDAQVFVYVSADSISAKIAGWKEGIRLGRSIDLVLSGEITQAPENQWISAEFRNLSKPNYRVYAEAKCGSYGNCFSFFLITWEGNYEAAKADLSKMVKNTALVEPYMKNLNDSFDWSGFLKNKYLYSFLFDNEQEKANNLWLCSDGSFKLDVTRKGAAFVKKNKSYYGKNSGTWTVDGVGPVANVVLNFNKLSPFVFQIEIRDNKIYIDGEHHFIVSSDDCN